MTYPIKDSICLSDDEIDIILDALDGTAASNLGSHPTSGAKAQAAAEMRTALFVRKQVRLRDETLKADAALRYGSR